VEAWPSATLDTGAMYPGHWTWWFMTEKGRPHGHGADRPPRRGGGPSIEVSTDPDDPVGPASTAAMSLPGRSAPRRVSPPPRSGAVARVERGKREHLIAAAARRYIAARPTPGRRGPRGREHRHGPSRPPAPAQGLPELRGPRRSGRARRRGHRAERRRPGRPRRPQAAAAGPAPPTRPSSEKGRGTSLPHWTGDRLDPWMRSIDKITGPCPRARCGPFSP